MEPWNWNWSPIRQSWKACEGKRTEHPSPQERRLFATPEQGQVHQEKPCAAFAERRRPAQPPDWHPLEPQGVPGLELRGLMLVALLNASGGTPASLPAASQPCPPTFLLLPGASLFSVASSCPACCAGSARCHRCHLVSLIVTVTNRSDTLRFQG